ncbi:MAG: MBL fold metallo-hydrolase [Bdellovibrionota bacterium]
MAKASQQPMIVTVLGCGTSVGAPMIGMQTKKQFKNPKNCRTRASVLIEPFGRPGPAVLIDTSPDFREQAIRFFPQKEPRLDAILLTHTHADHLHGLDDIRPFNFFQKEPLPMYGEPEAMDQVRIKFAYIFESTQEGGGKPRLNLHPLGDAPFRLKGAADPLLHSLEVTPLPLIHGSISCMGYRVGNFAYLTDCSLIPDLTLAKMQGLDLLILDCLRPKPHSTHLHVELALDYARRIGAKKTVFTHMGWELEYEEFKKSLPRGMVPAFDGMKLKVAL